MVSQIDLQAFSLLLWIAFPSFQIEQSWSHGFTNVENPKTLSPYCSGILVNHSGSILFDYYVAMNAVWKSSTALLSCHFYSLFQMAVSITQAIWISWRAWVVNNRHDKLLINYLTLIMNSLLCYLYYFRTRIRLKVYSACIKVSTACIFLATYTSLLKYDLGAIKHKKLIF